MAIPVAAVTRRGHSHRRAAKHRDGREVSDESVIWSLSRKLRTISRRRGASARRPPRIPATKSTLSIFLNFMRLPPLDLVLHPAGRGVGLSHMALPLLYSPRRGQVLAPSKHSCRIEPRTKPNIMRNDFDPIDRKVRRGVGGGRFSTVARGDQLLSGPRALGLVLLCHKFWCPFRAAQHGQRESVVARAATNLRRIVAIEFGTWRSGRNGGSSGLVTFA